MNRLHTLLIGIFGMACVAGCEKRCTQYNVCTLGGIGYQAPRFIGYARAEVDTQIIIQYKPTGRFDEPLDTGAYIFPEPGSSWFPDNNSDTQSLGIGFSGSARNTQRINDVRLILPGIRSYSFTDVMVDGEFAAEDDFKCSSGSFGCRRHIVSLKIDGAFKDFSGSDSRLELHK